MENDLLAHPDHGRFRSYLHPGIPVHPRVPLCGPLNMENASSILPAVKNTVVPRETAGHSFCRMLRIFLFLMTSGLRYAPP